MHVSRQYRRQIRSNGEFQREERTDVSLEFNMQTANLKIEYEVRSPGAGVLEATTIDVRNIDIYDIQSISENLTTWCLEDENSANAFETGFLEGECIHDDGKITFENLRVEIDRDGIHFYPRDHDLTVGSASIPASTSRTEQEQVSSRHHHEFDLLLRTALQCVTEDDGQSNRHLDIAGEFSGPLHEDLHEGCVSHYLGQRGAHAVTVAAQSLEHRIREEANAPEQRSSNLFGALFSEGSPRFEASSLSHEQEGVRMLFQGAVKAIRNPLAHRDPESATGESRYLDSFSQRYARDMLYFYDLLYLLLENEINVVEE
jgi:hypothetical protein